MAGNLSDLTKYGLKKLCGKTIILRWLLAADQN